MSEFKKIFTNLIFSLIVFSVFMSAGCQISAKKIEENDYPTPDVIIEDKPTVKTAEDIEKLNKDALKEDVDSLSKDDRFYFNPTFIPERLKGKYVNNPKVVRMARDLMNAVYETDKSINFSESEYGPLTDQDVEDAIELANVSGILLQGAEFRGEGVGEWEIVYFPTLSFTATPDNDFDFTSDDGISSEEARVKFENTVDYINHAVNDNLNKDSTAEERARKIYEQLVRDFEIDETINQVTISYQSDGESDDEGNDPENITVEGNAFGYGGVINGIESKKFMSYDLSLLYSYILDQLHIDSYAVSAGGNFKGEASFANFSGMSDGWGIWNIVKIQDNYYHCSPGLEIMVFKDKHPNDKIETSDLSYFGMSDEKMKETFDFRKSEAFVFNDLYGNGNWEIPECTDSLHY